MNIAIESKKPLNSRFYLHLAIFGLIVLVAWQLSMLAHGFVADFLGHYRGKMNGRSPMIANFAGVSILLISLPFLIGQFNRARKRFKQRDSQLIVVDPDLLKLEHWASKNGKITKNCLNFSKLIKLEAATHKVTGLKKLRGIGILVMTIGYELEGRHQGFQFKLNHVNNADSLADRINAASPNARQTFAQEIKQNSAKRSTLDKLKVEPTSKKTSSRIPADHMRYCPN